MRVVLQRVSRAGVRVDGGPKREIGQGLALLVGVCPTDNEDVCRYMVDKILALRIFGDENGNLNLSLRDIDGELLIVSNFTLYANCKKGRRPSFVEAAPPTQAQGLYDTFVRFAGEAGVKNLQTGEFGGDMEVEIINDGPVTILLDSDQLGAG